MGLEKGNIYQHELSAEFKFQLQEFYEVWVGGAVDSYPCGWTFLNK
jgi:hypothetical protein